MTSGEQWAAAELEELRARRFAPWAWTHLLSASFTRAAETRKARPRLTRQARTWSAAGLCAGVAVCSSGRFPAPQRSRFALWWLATSAMLDWHLGMLEGADGEQRGRLSAGDAFTLLRLWGIPFLWVHGDPAQASAPAFTALITAAAVTDALDGAFARRAGPTRLGRDLDTVADTMTSLTATRAAHRAGWLPAGAAGLVTARSTIPILVIAATYFRTGQRLETTAPRATRQIAPILFAGLAVAPASSRAGATLSSAASIGALTIAWRTRCTS